MSESITDIPSSCVRIDSQRKEPFLMARVGSRSVYCTFSYLANRGRVSMVPGSNSVTMRPRFMCYPVLLGYKILRCSGAVMKLCTATVPNKTWNIKMTSEIQSMLCMGENSGFSH
jgi:hypothetical protein